MNKNTYDIYFDLGSSKLRVAGFDKKEKNQIFFFDKNCLSNLKSSQLELLDTEKTIDKTIIEIEKKTGEHLKDINLMLDTPDAISIILSVSKQNEKKNISKKDIQYVIQDAKQQILSSNQDKNIIHIIINNYRVDDKNFETLPLNMECKKLSIDIVFICFPKVIVENLKKLFSKHQISINQFICSSYAKSFNYKNHFTKYDKIAFLDIGYEKTSVIFYEKEKLKLFNVLAIGGNHITKDISKVLNLNAELSEKIKSNLNNDIIFSENEGSSEIFDKEVLNIIREKKLSFDLVKKVIFARIEETLNLSFKIIDKNVSSDAIKELKIILIGQGSKILDNKYIDMTETIPLVDEIDFFEESVLNICESGLQLNEGINLQEVQIIPKQHKNRGLFEKLFYFFK